MNKLFTKIGVAFAGIAMAVGVGVGVGTKHDAVSARAESVTDTYVFTAKEWTATKSSESANWTNNKTGSSTEARGIAVQAGASGAGATSPVEYSNITSITITLSKSNKGVGSVAFKVGTSTVKTQSSFTTTATGYTATASDIGDNDSGYVSFVVTCTTSTIYVQSVAITYESSESDPSDATLNSSLTVTHDPDNLSYYGDSTDDDIDYSGAILKAHYYSPSEKPSWAGRDVVLTNSDLIWTLNMSTLKLTATYTDEESHIATAQWTVTKSGEEKPKLVTWNLTKASYSSASTEQVIWTSLYAYMTWDKNTSSQDANAYLGGSNSTSRAYTNQIITVSANAGYGITKIVFNGESSYLAGVNGDWTGDANDYSASLSGTALTVDLSGDVSAALSYTVTATTRFTSLSVYYQAYEAVAMSLTAASNKTTLTSIGDTVQLTATAYSDEGKTSPMAGIDFSFESGTTSVATVSSTGLVTAVATGTSTITATTGELSESITIKVLYVSIDLVNSGSNLEAGSSGTFSFTWSSSDLKPLSPTVSWSSSNSTAISVTAGTGSYTAGSAGTNSTITVTATADGVTYTATRQFSVVSTIVTPTHISVTESAGVTAYMGTDVSLHITVLGAGDVAATNQNVTCTSSKTDVLTVTDDGVITPVARGVATVTIVDEGELCTPVVISVRVRNKVIGDAKELGELDLSSYKSSTPSSDVTSDYEAKNSYAAPTEVALSGYYYSGTSEDAARFGKSGGSGSITFTFASLKVARVDVHAKLWSGDSGLLTVTNGSTTGSFSDSEYNTVSYTLSESVTEITITAAGKPRFYIDSVKLYGERADVSTETNAQACYAFEEDYMHLDDYDPELHEGVDGNNWCKDNNHNYYGKNAETGAKAHFNGLTLAQRQMFTSNAAFADSWARLQAWATANGDSLDSSTQLAQASIRNPLLNVAESTNATIIIVVTSLVSLTAVGGYFLLKKKKKQ